MRVRLLIVSLLLSLLGLACGRGGQISADEVSFVPTAASGLQVVAWAQVWGARSLALSPDGQYVFAGSAGSKVHRVAVKTQQSEEFLTGLQCPNGVTFTKDAKWPALIVAETGRLCSYQDWNDSAASAATSAQEILQLPRDRHHGRRYIKTGPDGKIMLAIGGPYNVGLSADEPRFATIARCNADGKEFEIVARGVRNSVGFDWQPQTGQFYFTDNGRDLLGDDIPPCELNRLDEKGSHFGFPYLWGNNQPDSDFGEQAPKGKYVPPVVEFQAHVAPLGCHFPRHPKWKQRFSDQILVAQHGSWNRSTPVGYQVVSVNLKTKAVTPILTGFLQEGKVSGRPVDFCELPDGRILVSDDGGGVIWALDLKAP